MTFALNTSITMDYSLIPRASQAAFAFDRMKDYFDTGNGSTNEVQIEVDRQLSPVLNLLISRRVEIILGYAAILWCYSPDFLLNYTHISSLVTIHHEKYLSQLIYIKSFTHSIPR